MATDPNKALLSDSVAIDKQQPDYGLGRKDYARVSDGQFVAGYKLGVKNNQVTSVAVPVVPSPPTAVVAVAGDTTASVSFTPPVQKPGQLPLTFTATSSPGGKTATGSAPPLSVTALTNGTPYTFTVKATNSVGDSVASAASAAVTPVAP